MLEIMAREIAFCLMSFSVGKKLAFLLFFYERMMPELRSFYFTEGLDFSVFQKAHHEFWRSLMDGAQSISWIELISSAFNPGSIAIDAALGAIGAGFANKMSTLARL